MATIAVFVVFPPELGREVLFRAMIIVVVVTTPLSRFVLGMLYEKHLVSEELRRLVQRDRLTDVATRDFFFAQMDGRLDAYGVSLMIDIDHFKAINDEHGHMVGDEVIKQVAEALRGEIRELDIVCRFGGEEFVVFLNESEKEIGWQVAERMRQSVAELTTPGNSGNIQVTISVGASMKESLEKVEEAIRRADECLYRAKRSGRNKTVVDWRVESHQKQKLVS